MRSVRANDTKPELIVRSLLHRLGYRFRLHGHVSKKLYPSSKLPGKPDIVLASRKTAIFVHGCFWHQHGSCSKSLSPATNVEFWQAKLQRNIERDREHAQALEAMGWRVHVVWECETRVPGQLADRLCEILQPKGVENVNY